MAIVMFLFIMKFSSLFAAFLCPNILISVSKCVTSDKPKVEIQKYNV
jgi:hypothetical protein